MGKTKKCDSTVMSKIVVDGISSRRDLCKKLGLSKACITQVVNRLLNSGYIEEGSPFQESRPGRKAVSLRLKPGLVYFLGTDLEGMAIRACILDCEKKVVSSGKRAIGPQWSIRKIRTQWLGLIEETLKNSGILSEKIAAIGVGLPGKVSRKDLSCETYLPPGRWVKINAGTILNKFNIGVTAANNVFCVSEYERRLGSAQNTKSFISVLVRYGLGVAMLSDNSFLNGEEIFTGEFGHMRIDTKGPICICGQKGCLDIFVSGRTWLGEKIHTDAILKRELAKRAKYLAIGLGNLLKIFHPSLVISNGIYNDYQSDFYPVLHDALNNELKGMQISVPDVLFGEPVEFKTSIGAAMRAANKFLEPFLEAKIFKTKKVK